MWTMIEGAIPESVVQETMRLIELPDAPSQNRHFRVEGKLAFLSSRGMRQLRKLMRHIAATLDLGSMYTKPAIAHAFFLIKSSNGPATKLHQDRGYWQNIESRPTMCTVWIALEDIAEDNGCLLLDPANRVAPDKLVSFNDASQPLYPHEHDHYGQEQVTAFATVIAEPDATRLNAALMPVICKRGDLVVFDSLEAHASTANTRSDRLAMKVVIGEAEAMNRQLISLDALIGTSAGMFPLVSTYFGAKERLRRIF